MSRELSPQVEQYLASVVAGGLFPSEEAALEAAIAALREKIESIPFVPDEHMEPPGTGDRVGQRGALPRANRRRLGTDSAACSRCRWPPVRRRLMAKASYSPEVLRPDAHGHQAAVEQLVDEIKRPVGPRVDWLATIPPDAGHLKTGRALPDCGKLTISPDRAKTAPPAVAAPASLSTLVSPSSGARPRHRLAFPHGLDRAAPSLPRS